MAKLVEWTRVHYINMTERRGCGPHPQPAITRDLRMTSAEAVQ